MKVSNIISVLDYFSNTKVTNFLMFLIWFSSKKLDYPYL